MKINNIKGLQYAPTEIDAGIMWVCRIGCWGVYQADLELQNKMLDNNGHNVRYKQ